MKPVFRDGDMVVVSPNSSIRRGDRVVVKTVDGEVMAKELVRRTAKRVELHSLNAEYPDRTLAPEQIAWMDRIVWASQSYEPRIATRPLPVIASVAKTDRTRAV